MGHMTCVLAIDYELYPHMHDQLTTRTYSVLSNASPATLLVHICICAYVCVQHFHASAILLTLLEKIMTVIIFGLF